MATAADALLAREATTDEADVAAADAPDLAALTSAADVEDAADSVALVAVAGDMLPVVSLGRTRSTPTLLQSATVMVLVSGEELRVQYGSRSSAGRDREFYREKRDLLSRSAGEQAFETSGRRVLIQSELWQIHFMLVMAHEVLLILLKAALEAHVGISPMFCAEVEVMERASA